MTKELIGRIGIKLSGREAGKTIVIVDTLENHFVLIDGNVKRRKCNINHLELTEKKLDIKKKASTQEVHEAMKKEKINVIPKKEKKQPKEKPKKQRKVKVKQTKNEGKRNKKKVPRVSDSKPTDKSNSGTDKHNKQ